MREPRTPELTSTYRVQMHAGFTLRDARGIVPYLSSLGVSHLYASPVLAARAGSQHGYDVVDPRRVNPELGTEEDLRALSASLHEHDMGLLLDIVPNHMGTGPANPYWEDVLAHGERSRFAAWFDIAWDMHDDRKLVLPVLSDHLDAVIEHGDLRVSVDENGARIHHFDLSVPVSPDSVPAELQLGQWDPAAIREAEAQFKGDQLRDLLDRQHYRLIGWRRGPREINYRRFFDVNDLVALRMEDPAVFDATHEYLLRLVAEGVIDGLRVDHIDGLREPLQYLRRLRAETDARRPGGMPIVVEKILSEGEHLRPWPVQGTTGYERLNDIEDLFIDPAGFAEIEKRYRARRRSPCLTFGQVVRADKRAVLERSFAADVERLARLLDTLLRAETPPRTREQIFQGIQEYIAATPVYRTYIVEGAPRDEADLAVLDAVELLPDPDTVASRIRAIMKGEATPGDERTRSQFIARMQQITGPAMAKGLEDTAHYAYIPLVSRNEVGGSPDRPLDGIVQRFHAANERFQRTFPYSLVTTSTHDTKRSGDVRARISAISELSADWQRALMRWRRLNRRHQQVVRGRIVPDPNAELLIYQTLVGIWPAPRVGRRTDDVPEKAWRAAAAERMTQYVRKAVREAKLRTTWTDPDNDYESALLAFVTAALSSPADDPFLVDLSRFVSCVAPIAFWNTLSRIVLHLTIPGTPDIYQGDEAWNFALVDPDNRRPVDYTLRQSMLELPPPSSPIDLWEQRDDPRVKMLVTHRLLALRKARPALFRGDYRPLEVEGEHADHLVAFERSSPDGSAIIIAPRLIGPLLDTPPGKRWSDTTIAVRTDAERRCAITGRAAVIRQGRILVAESCGPVPLAVLV